MRLLVVEDDENVGQFIKSGLEKTGFSVDLVGDGQAGLEKTLALQYDVAIVDIMLPGLDGLSLIEEARRNQIRTPMLILSAKRTVDERVRGLQAGGDDYLVKPFAFAELVARVQALARRSQDQAEPTVFRVGDLTIDLVTRRASRGATEIELQTREFALLEYLMRNAGRVVARSMIMKDVWGYNYFPETNVIEVAVCRLRDKVDKGHDKTLIHTIRGVGYVMEERD
ncbi:MAG TPA: response regulator transcription factor [Candidatus Hydrogenedentes bacterium]|nr:response regulator transcription factor [Candidatus Hydrogenedentota bacterium]HPG66810.1 response regulator transcription factor [Candidatus Hydrogenedentota bacterium]